MQLDYDNSLDLENLWTATTTTSWNSSYHCTTSGGCKTTKTSNQVSTGNGDGPAPAPPAPVPAPPAPAPAPAPIAPP